jgi:hypothetical protein
VSISVTVSDNSLVPIVAHALHAGTKAFLIKLFKDVHHALRTALIVDSELTLTSLEWGMRSVSPVEMIPTTMHQKESVALIVILPQFSIITLLIVSAVRATNTKISLMKLAGIALLIALLANYHQKQQSQLVLLAKLLGMLLIMLRKTAVLLVQTLIFTLILMLGNVRLAQLVR